MKKLITWFAFLAAALSFSPGQAFAAGTFTVASFPDSLHAVVAENFKTTFQFFYSGSQSGLHASIANGDAPDGLYLGNILSEATNSYSVEYSGVPKKGGYYTLTLLLSDDSGAVFSKNFNISIAGFSFREEAFLNAILNQPYSTSLRYDYPGTSRPRIRFYDVPGELQFSYTDIYGENGSFLLRFTPRKTGTFALKGDVSINSVVIMTGKTFTFSAVEPPKYAPTTITVPSKPKSSSGSSAQKPAIKIAPASVGNPPPGNGDATSTASTSPEAVQKSEGFFTRLWRWLLGLFH